MIGENMYCSIKIGIGQKVTFPSSLYPKNSTGMCYLGHGTKKLTLFQNLDLTTHPIMLLFLDRDRLSANIGVPILFTVVKDFNHMFT